MFPRQLAVNRNLSIVASPFHWDVSQSMRAFQHEILSPIRALAVGR